MSISPIPQRRQSRHDKPSKDSRPHFEVEKALFQEGFRFICGIDEAGRGALAGPLVAGAVILNKGDIDLDDSKKLSAKKRQKMFEIIKLEALAWSVGIVEVDEINKFGLQSATYLAYQRAIDSLATKPDFLLIDHYRLPATEIHQNSITFGDQISLSIAGASIVAKVTRDEIMKKLPGSRAYGFQTNFGYGTSSHLKAIKSDGPSTHHRNYSFDKLNQTAFNFNKSNKKENNEVAKD